MTKDLIQLVREWALAALPYDRSNIKLCGALDRKDARELLIIFHNWMTRNVQARPRQVLMSRAYSENTRVQARQEDLEALLKKITRGEDIKPHLSTRVDIVWEEEQKPLGRRRDLDLMLIEWQVHHLHISQELQSNGFVKRDGPLLFAVFRPNTAYVLDLMSHADFNRDHILRILADEWPGADLIYEIKGSPSQRIIGLSQDYTEDERNQLRKVGINTLIEIDGRVFKPAGGMTTAGTSIDASRAADSILLEVDKWQTALDADRPYFERFARKFNVEWPKEPEFEFGFVSDEELGFVELQTMLAFSVTPTRR